MRKGPHRLFNLRITVWRWHRSAAPRFLLSLNYDETSNARLAGRGTPMTFAALHQLSSAFEQFRTSREVSAWPIGRE
jgi:hypothetical protein